MRHRRGRRAATRPARKTRPAERCRRVATPTQLDRPTLPSGSMYWMHWPALWTRSATGVPIGELPLQVDVRLDAKQLDLQLPDDDVGDVLIDLSSVAIGPEQRERRRNEKTGKGDGHDPQRQRPFEIETRRCNGFHSQPGILPLRRAIPELPCYTRPRCKESSRPIDGQFARTASRQPRCLGWHHDTVSRGAGASGIRSARRVLDIARRVVWPSLESVESTDNIDHVDNAFRKPQRKQRHALALSVIASK